jgi:hypothetical protein
LGLRDLKAKNQRTERKGGLGALRSKPTAPAAKGLGALRKPQKSGKTLAQLRAERKASSKNDFQVGGIRFHNCRQHDGYWTVDVSNGDETITFHNRFKAWFANVPGRDGYMKEPVRDIVFHIHERWLAELKALKVPTPAQVLAAKDEAERKTRGRNRKDKDE